MKLTKKCFVLSVVIALIMTSLITSGSGPVNAAVQTVTVTFQNGTDGYTGSRDVSYIREYLDSESWMGYFSNGKQTDIPIWDDGIRGQNGLIYFDLNQLPPNAIITSAQLKMYAYWGCMEAGTVDIYKITDPDNKGMWTDGDISPDNQYRSSGAAYLKRDGGYDNIPDPGWTDKQGSTIMDSVYMENGVPVPSLITTYNKNGTSGDGEDGGIGWKTFDLTGDVQSFADGTSVNQGWYFKPELGTGVHINFSSDESDTNKPMLEITYTTDPSVTYTPRPTISRTPIPTKTPVPTPTPTPPITLPPNTAYAAPELPREYVDTTYDEPAGGNIIKVNQGDDFQKALDDAQPGDIIELQAGAVFTGNFQLPVKNGNDWIYIRSSEYDKLPSPGSRVSPSDAAYMPKIVTPNKTEAISGYQDVHNYRFTGLEVTMSNTSPDPGALVYQLMNFDYNPQDLTKLPHDIVIDRCYIHGNSTGALKRCITLDTGRAAVIDSYCADAHQVGQDAQAIGPARGSGPFKINNNYLEGSTENIMFGGVEVESQDMVPSDIEFRNNYCFKPLSWKNDIPGYPNWHWAVKNSFEIKSARRALIDGNIFENNWADGQDGTAILFTPRGMATYCADWNTCQDITFTNNFINNTVSVFGILGHDNYFPDQTIAKNVMIKNNLIINATGHFTKMIDGADNFTYDHNTIFSGGDIILTDGRPSYNCIFINNIIPHNDYGIIGSGRGIGWDTINNCLPGNIILRNVLQGGNKNSYPANNYFPSSMNDVGFTDLTGGNYKLVSSSPYGNAGTDGKDIGADIDLLNYTVAGVVDGYMPEITPPPVTPPPTPTPVTSSPTPTPVTPSPTPTPVTPSPTPTTPSPTPVTLSPTPTQTLPSPTPTITGTPTTTVTSPSPTPVRISFPDISEDNFGWAQDAVEILAGKGIINGTNVNGQIMYLPGEKITRAQLCKLLVVAYAFTQGGETVQFSDVGEHWAAIYIEIASSQGIVKGYEDNTFRPEADIRREELAVMISRAMNKEEIGTPVPDSEVEQNLATFLDQTAIDSWARKDVAFAVLNGIIKGSPTDGGFNFLPQDTANRAETAVMIKRAYDKLN